MWYMAQAKGEIIKPLQFWNETLLILTFLSVKGINVKISWMIGIYLIVFIFIIIIGKIIVKIGMVSYTIKLGNSQNLELLEILERIKNIEAKL